MDLPRILATGLALNRMAFGLNYLLRPESAGPSRIGRVAKRPGARVMSLALVVAGVSTAVGGAAAAGMRRP